jgi:hypothetical protein
VSVRWIRVRPGGRETLQAAVVAGAMAVGVGTVAFYLTRLFLAREPLAGPGLPARRDDARALEDGEA